MSDNLTPAERAVAGVLAWEAHPDDQARAVVALLSDAGQTVTIALPWVKPPLSQNDRDERNRGGARKIAKAKEEARAAIRAQRIEPIVGANVTLHYRVPNRIRRDADNLAVVLKVVQDALVLEGVLPRDDWVCVPHSGQTIHPPSDAGPAMWLELSDITTYQEKP